MKGPEQTNELHLEFLGRAFTLKKKEKGKKALHANRYALSFSTNLQGILSASLAEKLSVFLKMRADRIKRR